MGVSGSVLSEDQLQCSICQDVFTDPVSIPCGHNFCRVCLEEFWNSSSICQCPDCTEEFSKTPELHVDFFISALAAQFKKTFQVESSTTPDVFFSSKKVLCDSCTEEKQMALRSCLDCGVSYCRNHLMPHSTTAKLRKHKLIEPVENLEDYICQKHKKPLELFCRDDEMFVCQFCIEGDHKSHTTVSIATEIQQRKGNLGETQAEVNGMIEEKKKKIKQIKQSVQLFWENTEKEKKEKSVEIFSELVRCIERSQAELLQVMEEKQRVAEKQAEEFIKELEQEITELKRRDTELEKLSHTEDHLHLLQMYPSMASPPHTKDWTDVSIHTHLIPETLRRSLSQLQEMISKEIEELGEISLQRIQQYAVDVTLDPDTAHPDLNLTADGKQVIYGDTRQNLPDNPNRFDVCPCVLGKKGFSSGRFYYEVQVKGKNKWILGVAGETSERKGEIMASPEDGYWSVCQRKKSEFEALDSPSVSLSLTRAPQKIGVFVDYEEGLVSFYDVEARSHIYSFTGQSFTEKLYPYFSPCTSIGRNSAPLHITPM